MRERITRKWKTKRKYLRRRNGVIEYQRCWLEEGRWRYRIMNYPGTTTTILGSMMRIRGRRSLSSSVGLKSIKPRWRREEAGGALIPAMCGSVMPILTSGIEQGLLDTARNSSKQCAVGPYLNPPYQWVGRRMMENRVSCVMRLFSRNSGAAEEERCWKAGLIVFIGRCCVKMKKASFISRSGYVCSSSEQAETTLSWSICKHIPPDVKNGCFICMKVYTFASKKVVHIEEQEGDGYNYFMINTMDIVDGLFMSKHQYVHGEYEL